MPEGRETIECPHCAEVILRKAIRCKHCGADPRTSASAGAVPKNVNGTPAILSLFIPGLGQIVKGHWLKAIAMYGLTLVTLIGCALLDFAEDPFVLSGNLDPHMANAIPWSLLVICILGLWVYGVVDAYNA